MCAELPDAGRNPRTQGGGRPFRGICFRPGSTGFPVPGRSTGTPASILRKDFIGDEAVHKSGIGMIWRSRARAVRPAMFAFFTDNWSTSRDLRGGPLTANSPASIAPSAGSRAIPSAPRTPSTAVFYSIFNTPRRGWPACLRPFPHQAGRRRPEARSAEPGRRRDPVAVARALGAWLAASARPPIRNARPRYPGRARRPETPAGTRSRASPRKACACAETRSPPAAICQEGPNRASPRRGGAVSPGQWARAWNGLTC